MSLTVNRVVADPQAITEDKDGIMTLLSPCFVSIWYTQDGQPQNALFRFDEGFKTDGGSVPKIFQRWLPSWKDDDPKYNAAFLVHDFLYCTKGAYGHFTRDEVDSIMRGILREAGMKRFWASAADFCVGLFAGGENHWGDNSLDSRLKAEVRFNNL